VGGGVAFLRGKKKGTFYPRGKFDQATGGKKKWPRPLVSWRRGDPIGKGGIT